MDYDDFDLHLTEVAGEAAIRAESPEGEDTRPLPTRISPETLAELELRFRDHAGRGRRPEGPSRAAGEGGTATLAGVEELASLGRELFELLLPSDVATLWHRSRARTAEARRGLRLRIHVDLRREAVAWFGTLPWEILYDDDSGGFLALDGRTPVVRHLDMRRPRRAPTPARPLRVLVVMPEPYGAARLDVERERESLRETWGEDDRVELVFPETATFDGVRDAMTAGPIHAIHYMGHGTYDEKAGCGGLVLEGAFGRETPVVGRSVGKLVTGVEPQPAFAVLNGCDTGRTGNSKGPWPFAFAAAALMDAGLPASVAMQLPIGDDEAVHFSRTLHRKLQGGLPVERAVSEARLSLSEEFAGPVWAIPALFMRVADGTLFPAEVARSAGGDGRPTIDEARVHVDRYKLESGEGEIVGRDEEAGGDTPDVRKTIVEARRIQVENGKHSVVGTRTRRSK